MTVGISQSAYVIEDSFLCRDSLAVRVRYCLVDKTRNFNVLRLLFNSHCIFDNVIVCENSIHQLLVMVERFATLIGSFTVF